MGRKVAITGLGIVCGIGNNKEEVWKSVKAGKTGVAPITRYDCTDQKVKLAAEIKGLNYEDYIDKKSLRKMDMFSKYAIVFSPRNTIFVYTCIRCIDYLLFRQE